MSDQLQNTDQPDKDGYVGIVVGIDGSPNSTDALRWAIAQSDRFGAVQPVMTWHFPWWLMADELSGHSVPLAAEDLQQKAEETANRIVETVGFDGRAPIVCQDSPGQTLVGLGKQANLIVVGTRGRGAVADAVLGSVSCHVASHATVPVAIVPLGATAEPPSRVVVGVDGSENSIAALVWAAENAPADARIEAVHAWSYQVSAIPEAASIPTDSFEQEARRCLDRSITEAGERLGGIERPIDRRLEYGDPRRVIAELATDQTTLLVIGARGHRGIAHLLLGSTTSSLVHRPKPTTVVVPASDNIPVTQEAAG